MLPDCRSIETFAVPKFELNRADIDNIEEELKEFQTEFHDCFIRSESRENIFQYAVGQINGLDRKSIEPMAINVEGAKVRPLQRFVSDIHWDDDKIEIKYRNMVNEDLGDERGVLIFDESGFPKKRKFLYGCRKTLLWKHW
jgi:SRSO17 transposase